MLVKPSKKQICDLIMQNLHIEVAPYQVHLLTEKPVKDKFDKKHEVYVAQSGSSLVYVTYSSSGHKVGYMNII